MEQGDCRGGRAQGQQVVEDGRRGDHGQSRRPSGSFSTSSTSTLTSSAQLRYLQTLNSIAAENNSTIIFPIPIDIVAHFMGGQNPNQQLLPPAPTHQVSWITFWVFSPVHHFQLSTTSTLRADDPVQVGKH